MVGVEEILERSKFGGAATARDGFPGETFRGKVATIIKTSSSSASRSSGMEEEDEMGSRRMERIPRHRIVVSWTNWLGVVVIGSDAGENNDNNHDNDVIKINSLVFGG